MDIVKGDTIEYDINMIMILGVEKSGKTTFIATCPRPILVFGFETGAESRLGGHKDIDFVRCYDLPGELVGSGLRRFEANWKQVLTAKELPYKTLAFDPWSFHSDQKISALKKLSTKDTRAAYGELRTSEVEVLNQCIALSKKYHIIVTSHVRLVEDDTTGTENYLADLNGSIRDSIGGWFDAVLFTKVTPLGDKNQYSLLALPDHKHKCGVRVPLGKEHLLKREMPSDFGTIVKTLKGDTSNVSGKS